jgi:hypothetical protein
MPRHRGAERGLGFAGGFGPQPVLRRDQSGGSVGANIRGDSRRAEREQADQMRVVMVREREGQFQALRAAGATVQMHQNSPVVHAAFLFHCLREHNFPR